MTPSPVTDLSVDPFQLDHADLARHLAALITDELSSSRALCRAIQASCWRRVSDAGDGVTDHPLTAAEQMCLDALDLNTQVCRGGFRQWVVNGYWWRGYHTHDALVAIGARRTARLLDKALRGLPRHAMEALNSGVPDSAMPYVDFGPRREAYFDRLDAAYYALEAAESIEALVAAFARGQGGGAVRHPAS